ncbi:hypothetical protein EON65_35335 [archaeon]|nr:MAG: hypothetical protein EON65_35335 [archaeon]
MNGLNFISSVVYEVPVKGKRTEYILDIGRLIESNKLIVSSSDRCIRIIDATTQVVCTSLFGHGSTVSCIVPSRTSSSVVFSSGLDNAVIMWDERVSHKPFRKIKLPGEVNSVTVSNNDTMIAAAVEQDISIYDVRKLKDNGNSSKLFFYDEMHSDTVTNLAFSSKLPHLLMSGAEDGLICLSDTTIQDYDESTSSILNTDCPVRRFGFYGSTQDGVYSLATVETASFWDHPNAQRIANLSSLREDHNIEYLVDCFESETSVMLLGGRYDGRGSVFRLEGATVTPYTCLEHGHTDTIRCALYADFGTQNVLFTGGEDGKLLAWKSGGDENGVRHDEDKIEDQTHDDNIEQRADQVDQEVLHRAHVMDCGEHSAHEENREYDGDGGEVLGKRHAHDDSEGEIIRKKKKKHKKHSRDKHGNEV